MHPGRDGSWHKECVWVWRRLLVVCHGATGKGAGMCAEMYSGSDEVFCRDLV